jgi:ethanolamine utilization microcompartment shell protein EutL
LPWAYAALMSPAANTSVSATAIIGLCIFIRCPPACETIDTGRLSVHYTTKCAEALQKNVGLPRGDSIDYAVQPGRRLTIIDNSIVLY